MSVRLSHPCLVHEVIDSCVKVSYVACNLQTGFDTQGYVMLNHEWCHNWCMRSGMIFKLAQILLAATGCHLRMTCTVESSSYKVRMFVCVSWACRWNTFAIPVAYKNHSLMSRSPCHNILRHKMYYDWWIGSCTVFRLGCNIVPANYTVSKNFTPFLRYNFLIVNRFW